MNIPNGARDDVLRFFVATNERGHWWIVLLLSRQNIGQFLKHDVGLGVGEVVEVEGGGAKR